MRNINVTKYYMILKGLFPQINFSEGRFLKDFKDCLIEFAKMNPSCSYEDLINEFGTPEEIVHDYILGKDFEYLFKLFKRKSYMKYIWLSILTGIIIVSISIVSLLYKDYAGAKEANVIIKETIITEGGE